MAAIATAVVDVTGADAVASAVSAVIAPNAASVPNAVIVRRAALAPSVMDSAVNAVANRPMAPSRRPRKPR